MEHFEVKNGNTDAEKKKFLFYKQKELLDTFLLKGAIGKAQYDKSLNCLKEKLLPEEEKS